MADQEPDPLGDIPTDQLMVDITRREPAMYYLLAARLLKEGRNDEAVFWYYVGQLRWRYYAMAHKDKVSGSEESALMGALGQSIGTAVNSYAFGDLPRLRQTIDEAIAWDEAQTNEHCPKDSVVEARAVVLDGLRELRQSTIDRADEIRKTRTENGLENR